uniref:O-acyltransferase WSD1 C-terminal domain-containing protein n=1 Tax=Clastoptera arizonana TaxID=38151 RepID=A0A1B6DJ53_9HEMI
MKPDWPQVSSKARRSIGQFQRRFRVLNIFYNLFSCCLMILLLPAFIFLFLIVNLNRYIWLVILKKKYPNLEFINSTSVRSAVDNPRNPGILTVLLQVKGSCNIHMFKTQVQRDLLNRTKNGRLVFPHLRTKLSSVWGWYAWDKETASNFNIDNHITITQPVLEDSHIQKYISELVSKYMNPDHPPWHLKIVPSSNKFFVLIRLHHLYLSEEHIGLGDILLLEPEHSSWSNEIDEYLYHENLLAGTFKTPVAIPQVYQHICECFSNFWNELVSVYDPIENPKIQISPTIKTYMIIILITMVSVMKEYLRTESSGVKYIIRRETQRRFITKRLLWRSILETINPLTSIKYFISWSWWFIVMSALQILRTILHIPQYIYWIFLSYHVFRELLYLAKIVFSGPRVSIVILIMLNLTNSFTVLKNYIDM